MGLDKDSNFIIYENPDLDALAKKIQVLDFYKIQKKHQNFDTYERYLIKIPSELKVQLQSLIHLKAIDASERLGISESLRLELLRIGFYSRGTVFKPHVDTYGWSMDKNFYHRKLSFSLLIQKADKGGDLLINQTNTPMRPGSLCFFKSDTVHEVCEIEEGQRITVFGFYRN